MMPEVNFAFHLVII